MVARIIPGDMALTPRDLQRIGEYISGAYDLDADFEAKVERDENGRFAPKDGGGSAPDLPTRARDRDGFVAMADGVGRATELFPDVHAVLTAANQQRGSNRRAGVTVPNGLQEQVGGFEIDYKRDFEAKRPTYQTYVRHVGKGRDAALKTYADALAAAGMKPRVAPFRSDMEKSPPVIWLDPRKR